MKDTRIYLQDNQFIDSLDLKHGDKLLSDILNRNDYSTNETFTGKYWTDGEPIYKKVIETTISNLMNSFNKVADLQYDTIVNHREDFVYNEQETYGLPIYGSESFGIYYRKDLGGIYEQHNYAFPNNQKLKIIVEYTK